MFVVILAEPLAAVPVLDVGTGSVACCPLNESIALPLFCDVAENVITTLFAPVAGLVL